MTQQNNLTSQPIHPFSLVKHMLAGAGAGLLLISVFVFSVKEPHPEWGKLWMIRPLVVVPFAGAMGGLCNYFIGHYRTRFGVNGSMAVLASAFIFMIGLWLGIVLGLDGTLWD